MYANSVPDAWCVTKRQIVQDPVFYKKHQIEFRGSKKI